MGNRMVFCPECRQNVRYSVKKSIEEAELRGEAYEIVTHTPYCERCSGEVYVAELEDRNLNGLYDAYRQKHGIIALEDIRSIPEKYNIGKRPLSLLLGWGEQTFSRYYSGDMPSKQYSEVLKQINADPAFYLSLLEENRGNLKSDKAYEKSKAATERLLGIPVEQPSKIDIAVDYLLWQCQDITPLSLQKALYYTQGFFYAFYRSFLFVEDCEAWVHGPVYREIYRRYSDYRFDPIDSIPEFDISSLSGEEKVLLDSIARHVCCYSGKTLEAFTNNETPWLSARGELPANVPSNNIIPKDAIAKYFTSVKEKYHMLTPSNIRDYTQSMFSQI